MLFPLGIILLDKDNCYTYEDGKLPIRPSFDKELLKNLVKENIITLAGYSMLPKSIQDVATVGAQPTLAITIKEIANSHTLIVIKGGVRYTKCKGTFRLDKFVELEELSNSQAKYYVRRRYAR